MHRFTAKMGALSTRPEVNSRVTAKARRFLAAWFALLLLVVFSGCANSEPQAQPDPGPVATPTVTAGASPSASAAPVSKGTVRIAAASDLKFALEELKKEYTAANPEADLQLTFGSSGTFFQQISTGAPFDLYLSADLKLAEQLSDAGLASADDVFSYAVGRLVVWAPETSPVDPTTGLEALLDPEAKKVSIANPEHAPYGKAAVAAMQTAGVYDQVKDKLVLGENIAQAAQFISSGNAQIGVIALSLALAPELSDIGRYAEVPLDSFPRLEQGGVVLAKANDIEAARSVREYLIGPKGLDLLKRYGFFLPGS